MYSEFPEIFLDTAVVVMASGKSGSASFFFSKCFRPRTARLVSSTLLLYLQHPLFGRKRLGISVVLPDGQNTSCVRLKAWFGILLVVVFCFWMPTSVKL